MKNYLEIVENTLKGEPKTPYRNLEGKQVSDTVGIFAAIFRHKMSDGFPLITTRKIILKNIAIELEGFIKGITSKSWFEERGCKYWSYWANPTKVEKLYQQKLKEEPLAFEMKEEYKKNIAREEDDLGPLGYSWQWRSFGQHYEKSESFSVESGYDQFKSIVDQLKRNPYDRRMVCSAWNPNQLHMMGLSPCHFAWNVVVYNGKLNLIWHQRSCDVAIGIPANIASYALLLKLLAKHAGLQEGELVGSLNDCHIYLNQVDVIKEQLNRKPLPLPTLEIPNNRENGFDIFAWDHTQLELKNYQSHGKLNFALEV